MFVAHFLAHFFLFMKISLIFWFFAQKLNFNYNGFLKAFNFFVCKKSHLLLPATYTNTIFWKYVILVNHLDTYYCCTILLMLDFCLCVYVCVCNLFFAYMQAK